MSSLQQRHNATEPFEALVFTSIWKNFFIRRKCEFAKVIISLVKFKRNKSDFERKDRGREGVRGKMGRVVGQSVRLGCRGKIPKILFRDKIWKIEPRTKRRRRRHRHRHDLTKFLL